MSAEVVQATNVRVRLAVCCKLMSFMALKCVPFFTVTCVDEVTFDLGADATLASTIKAWANQLEQAEAVRRYEN